MTELPIGLWTENFKDLLIKICGESDDPLVQNFNEQHTESKVDFEIILTKTGVAQLSESNGKQLSQDKIVSMFKLESNVRIWLSPISLACLYLHAISFLRSKVSLPSCRGYEF